MLRNCLQRSSQSMVTSTCMHEVMSITTVYLTHVIIYPACYLFMFYSDLTMTSHNLENIPMMNRMNHPKMTLPWQATVVIYIVSPPKRARYWKCYNLSREIRKLQPSYCNPLLPVKVIKIGDNLLPPRFEIPGASLKPPSVYWQSENLYLPALSLFLCMITVNHYGKAAGCKQHVQSGCTALWCFLD